MNELEQLRAHIVGVHSVFFAVLGAVIRTHPDPTALAGALAQYRQREQTYLENQSIPEHVLDQFHAAWKRVEIEIQSRQESRH